MRTHFRTILFRYVYHIFVPTDEGPTAQDCVRAAHPEEDTYSSGPVAMIRRLCARSEPSEERLERANLMIECVSRLTFNGMTPEFLEK